MSNDSDWYPAKRDKQRAMFVNVLAKIEGHIGAMPNFLTDDRVERIKTMCQVYIAVSDWLAQNEARLRAAYEFQKDLEKGIEGETVAAPPGFASLGLPRGAFKGFVTAFRKEIGLLKKQDGYTPAIGADLMIVREKGESVASEQRQPAFKYEIRQGFRIYITGSMQGMAAANFYYRRKGQSEWLFAGYLTRAPGEIRVPPAQTGVPETCDIKAIFSENNIETGQFSDNKEITLS